MAKIESISSGAESTVQSDKSAESSVASAPKNVKIKAGIRAGFKWGHTGATDTDTKSNS